MKCLIVLLILALSAIAYSQERKVEFKAAGFIDVQSAWFVNATPGNPAAGIYDALHPHYKFGGGAFDKTVGYLESRAHLKFDMVAGRELSGTIHLETDAGRWGAPDGTRNSFGYWSADRSSLEVKNVFVDVGLPYFGIPFPMLVRMGLQPLYIRGNVLVYTDGMGVTGLVKMDPLEVQPFWFKAIEGRDATADDVDVYGLQVKAKVDQITLGGYGLYYDMNTYPLNASSLNYGDGTQEAKMLWLGVFADGKAGPVNFNADFIYDTGKIEDPRIPTLPEVKCRGWMTYVKVDYPWQKYNFGVVGLYASGADTRKTSSTGLPGSATSTGVNSTRVESYVVPPSSEEPGMIGESVVFYGTWVNRGASGIGNGGHQFIINRGAIGGTWMAKLYGSYKVAPDLKITLQGLYIGDTTRNGNTVGTAVKSDGKLRDDKAIGWEADIIAEWMVYKNLKFSTGFGYLWAGDGLDLQRTSATNVEPKNPWQLVTNLTYLF
ncbi:MAG: hypothetical protein ACE144_14105 [Thermodesulfobacteriota bacterium]